MISTIIIVAGLLGGVINLLSDTEPITWRNFGSKLLSGLGASCLMPLFLNMISSSLLDETSRNPNSYYVLFGFCLIAAICSRNFIQSISRRVLQEVEQVKESVEEVKEQVEPILIKETTDSPNKSIDEEQLKLEFKDQEIDIIKSLLNPKYSMRTVTGIAMDTGMDVSQVSGYIGLLLSRGLVHRLEKGNKRFWYLTQSGREKVSGVLPTDDIGIQ